MCVIMACMEGIPSLNDLKRGEDQNGDGGGVGYYVHPAGGGEPQIYYKKGLTAEQIHEEIQGKPLPLMIHFRIASIGAPIPILTHPFPVTKDASLALEGYAPEGLLMHNGTWSDWSKEMKKALRYTGKKLPKGEFSDSRAMAWFAANFGLEALEDLIGDTQKIAFMTREKLVFWPIDRWWDSKKGWYYSSHLWSSSVSTVGGSSYSTTDKRRHVATSEEIAYGTVDGDKKEELPTVPKAQSVEVISSPSPVGQAGLSSSSTPYSECFSDQDLNVITNQAETMRNQIRIRE